MKRTMLLMRLFAILSLSLWMFGAASVSSLAQNDEPGTEQTADETPTDGDETADDTDESGNEDESEDTTDDTGDEGEEPAEEPAEEPVDEPATGTLTVVIHACTTGGDAGTGAVFADGEFAPDESCTDAEAAIATDGGEATTVSGSADFTLDAGVHTVADATTGAALDVEVVADAGTTVSVVAYAESEDEAADDEEADDEGEVEAAAVTTVQIVKHDCVPDIQTVEVFEALGDVGQLIACPAITLPADAVEEGDVLRGDPADFDFTFETETGEPLTLSGNGTFVADTAPTCEADLGADLDGDPDTNLCFDASGYEVSIDGGPITITESTIPAKHVFGTVELADATNATLVPDSIDAETGSFAVDPSDDGQVTIHVYNFSLPRVSVIVHNCDETVESTDDLEGLIDFAAQVIACPAVTLDGDAGEVSDVNGGTAEFAFSLIDDTAIEQTLDDATFVDELICELDQNLDLDGDDTTNLCLSGYAFDDVSQASPVTLTETTVPDGYIFGTALTNPEAILVDTAELDVDADAGTVTIDTVSDSNVTVHVFNLLAPDDNGNGGGNNTGGNNTGGNNTGGNNTGGNNTGGNNTGGNNTGGNNTGGGNPGGGGDGSDGGENTGGEGTVEIWMLYCLTDSEYTQIEVMAPGEEVDPYSFGDDTCAQDGNEFQVTLFSRDDLDPFDVGYEGVIEFALPSTTGDDPHLLTDTWSGTTAAFEVESGVRTQIVVLAWELDDYSEEEEEYEEEYYEDEEEYADDEEEVEDGEDLPDTGIGATSSTSSSLIALLALGGLLTLGGAHQLRRGNRA